MNKFKNEKGELSKLKSIETGIIDKKNAIDYEEIIKTVDGLEKERKEVEKNIFPQLVGLDMI